MAFTKKEIIHWGPLTKEGECDWCHRKPRVLIKREVAEGLAWACADLASCTLPPSEGHLKALLGPVN